MLLVVFESDLLFRLQEHDLFLHTPLFFQQRMVTAGGLLTWAGSYLTQFFYYPILGAGLLCLLWVFLMWLLKQAFRIEASWMAVTLVPIACLLLTIVDLGYWTYYLKLHGHAFTATVGCIVAVGLTWLYGRLTPRWLLSAAFILLAACVGYPLFGFYGLLAVALMGIAGRRAIDGVVAVIAIVGVPLVCYHTLYHETNIVNIYWTALPVYAMRGERYFAYNLPYIVLVTSLIAMSLARFKPVKGKWVSAVVLPVVIGCTAFGWNKDGNFHRELAMTRNVEQQQWEQVLQKARGVKGEPTRAVCMMKNLALSRLGRQGDEMFRYPEGACRSDAPFPIRMVQTVGKLLYLEYGVTNYCYRWCMEDGVEYGWTVEQLKLMARCSLLNGETVAAQRFLNMLKKTDFHRKWARQYEAYLSNPKFMSQDADLTAISALMRKDDFLTADMAQMERFLTEHFTTAEGTTPQLLEQTLIAAMQTKDMRLFWRRFYQYTEQLRERRAPTHYQEAACLFGHLMNIDVSHMPFDRQVTIDYEEFAATLGRMQREGWKLEQIGPQVKARFGNTYYYDFYFNRYDYIEN